jgi:hypothetical protein
MKFAIEMASCSMISSIDLLCEDTINFFYYTMKFYLAIYLQFSPQHLKFIWM